MLESHVVLEGGVRQPRHSAEGAAEGGAHLGDGDRLAEVIQIVVRLGEDALHGMVGGVDGAGGAVVVAGAAQVVVVADEAFEALAAEVAREADVALGAFVHAHR